MITRKAKSEIIQLLEEFSAVGVLGPRQVGKTTLAEEIAVSFTPEPPFLLVSAMDISNQHGLK